MSPGLTSINLGPKAETMDDSYPFFQLRKWLEVIDRWLNENCEIGTYFANRFMRYNFKNPGDALAFKLMFGN